MISVALFLLSYDDAGYAATSETIYRRPRQEVTRLRIQAGRWAHQGNRFSAAKKLKPEAARRRREVLNPELGNSGAQKHAAQYQPDDAQRDPYIRLGRSGALSLRFANDLI
jgi:hypothetical protein